MTEHMTEHRTESRDEPEARSYDWRGAAIAALLVVATALLLFAIHPAFFVKDDFQLQYLPGSREVARAWSEGELPLLSRFSWICVGLAAEYQFGVFSVVRTMLDIFVWLLPLSLTGRGAFLLIAHAAIAGAGTFLLARSFGATRPPAMMAALAAALNGWILWWGTSWYPGIAGFAWLPWYWLALRAIARGGSRWAWLGAALSLYLLVTAGWPYSVAMAVLIAAMSFFAALARRQWRAASIMVGGSALGLALSAPAALMLLDYFRSTARLGAASQVEDLWVVPPAALFGLIVPAFTTEWTVFVGSMPHGAVELTGAFVPLLLVAGAMSRAFLRRHLPELLLIAAVIGLLLIPSAGPFRWSFRWLPLLHLALAVIGAAAWEEGRRRAPLAGLGLLLAACVAAFAIGVDVPATLLHASLAASLCLGWFLLERKGREVDPDPPSGMNQRARWVPAGIVAVLCVATFSAFSHAAEVPAWKWDDALLRPEPLDPSRRYLAMYDFDQIVAGDERGRYSIGLGHEMRPGNLPMLAGVEFINGYSPLGLAAMMNVFLPQVHGPLNEQRADELLRNESGPQQLLHHLGVDGVVASEKLVRRNRETLAQHGWAVSGRVGSSLVLHRRERLPEPLFSAALAWKAKDEDEAYSAMFGRRTRQLPVVLYTPGTSGRARYGRRTLSGIVESRLSTTFIVESDRPPALIVFRRPWLPGWKATLAGEELPVLRADMIMPAVEIPSGRHGEVRLFYRPASLIAGGWIAAGALLVIAALALAIRLRGRNARRSAG